MATSKRKALSLAPTYETLESDKDAYLHSLKLRPLAKKYGRFWSFHSVPTTVALPGNRFAKSLKPFTAHKTEASFRELLAEYSEHGCPRPSSYADVFHEKFKSPRVSYSINSMLAPCMAGGWQASLKPGRHTGTHYKYDMRSAYLWAASLGLPDAQTYTRSLSPMRTSYDGLYRVKLIEPNPSAPFPFDRATEVIATGLELETYNLRVSEIWSGVTWKRTLDPQPLLDAIRLTSTWKLAGRAFWGRWAQSTRVTCHSTKKEWTLPPVNLNIPWAHLIVSRVRMRLWEHSTDALHVFVDSVITPHTLPTGNELGDWRLEKTYDNGVIIRAPGQYGDALAERLERMSGAAQDSPRRNTASVA